MEAQKNYKMQGLFGSVIIHLILLLLLFFMILSLPNPPLDELAPGGGGLELNYGTDDAGFGEQQATGPAGTDAKPTPTTPEQTTPEPTVRETPTPTPDLAEKIITSDETGNEIKLAEEKKRKEEVEKQKRIADEKEKQRKKLNTAASYPTTPATGSNTSGSNNNGDKPGTVGDQGSPKGTLNGKALYGEGGTGGGTGGGNGTGTGKGNGPGASLNMAGWMWDGKPKVNDNTDESGRIVFEIKINADGEIQSVRPIEKSVSPTLVRKYQAEVEKLTFSKSNGQGASEGAIGYITFIIRSR